MSSDFRSLLLSFSLHPHLSNIFPLASDWLQSIYWDITLCIKDWHNISSVLKWIKSVNQYSDFHVIRKIRLKFDNISSRVTVNYRNEQKRYWDISPRHCPVQYMKFKCCTPGTRKKKTLKNIIGGWEQSTFLVIEVKGHNHPDNDSNSAIILGDIKNIV